MGKVSQDVMELPLLFPPLEVSPRRYIINDVQSTVRVHDPALDLLQSSPEQRLVGSLGTVDPGFLRGGASASFVGTDSKAVIVTSLLPETPWILSVALLRCDSTSCDPVIIQLDLGSESKIYQETVKVKAFLETNGCYALVLVDKNGIILYVMLDSVDLVPAGLRVVNVESLLPDSFRSVVVPASVRSSMVGFLSPRRVLLALNPLLLAVDIPTNSVEVWSKTICLEAMRSRQSTLGNIFSKSVELLMGKIDHKALTDMNRVSALCVVDGDSRHAFTLHSDGKVRQWNILKGDITPYEVVDLEVNHIPSNHLWSDTDHSTTLCARLYDGGRVFALGIGVQTAVPADDDDDSNCHLIVVDGTTNIYDESFQTHSMTIDAPSSAQSLIDMQFDPRTERCSIVGLFQGPHGEVLHASYGPSTVLIVDREPKLLDTDRLLDGIARQEKRSIELLTFERCMQPHMDMDTMIHEVNKGFLRFLFRPYYPKGSGAVSPPPVSSIRRALSKLLHLYKPPGETCSIEQETLLAIMEWRRKDALAHRGEGVAISRMQGGPSPSWYDALVENDVDMDVEGEESADEKDKYAEAMAHERRWKQLLMQIWEEEATSRAALLLQILPYESGDEIIVRSSSVTTLCALQRPEDKTHKVIVFLDEIIAKLDRAVREDENLERELSATEALVWNIVSKGQLAVDPDCLQSLKNGFRNILGEILYERVLSSQDCEKVINYFNVPSGAMIEILRQHALHSVPCRLAADHSISELGAVSPIGLQSRMAVRSGTVQCLDSLKRLYLRRFLVFSRLSSDGEVEDTCLVMYLHSISVLWAAAQYVAKPLSKESRQRFIDTSPRKRPSFGNEPGFFVPFNAQCDKVPLLDVIIHSASRRQVFESNAPLCSNVAAIISTLFRRCLWFASPDEPISHAGYELPELRVLPQDFALDNPNIAMKLVAPHVLVSIGVKSEEISTKRKELLAECLLCASCVADEESGQRMVDRALELLPFDCKDMELTMKRISMLSRHIDKSARFSAAFVTFLENSLRENEIVVASNDDSGLSDDYARLCSILFTASISIHEWEKAFGACLSNPCDTRRREDLKRLVRSLVDEGALTVLAKECKKAKGQASGYNEIFHEAVDFYGLATETLSDSSRDIYTHLAVDPDSCSDYLGALHALHVSQQEWKMVAQTLNQRFECALTALLSGPAGAKLDETKSMIRERLITDDLIAGATGCFHSMSEIAERARRFVILGENSYCPTLPASLTPDNDPRAKRNRKERNYSEFVDEHEFLYVGVDDLRARALFCSVVGTLSRDESMSLGDLQCFIDGMRTRNDLSQDFLDILYERGYFRHALMLGKVYSTVVCRDSKGYLSFDDCVLHLLQKHVVPAYFDMGFDSERPTTFQLQNCIDCLNDKQETAALILSPRSKKVSSLPRSVALQSLECVMKLLATRFSSSNNSIAANLASMLLEFDERECSLPHWLERLLLLGSGNDGEAGLFASRPTSGSYAFLGDPSTLLSLYIKFGMYEDACRVVCFVLDGKGKGSRMDNAANRLPEKGNIDFVPYSKIDLLWNLIEVSVEKGILKAERKKEILTARKDVEEALERHFSLLKISKMGYRSARALI